MKPKTIIQKRVFALHEKLPAISSEQHSWMIDTFPDKYLVVSRKTIFCLECGHSWKDEVPMFTKICDTICPKCNAELKPLSGYKKHSYHYAYFCFITTFKKHQVVRYFFVTKYCKKNQARNFTVKEVMQHWVNPQGKITSFSMPTQSFSFYYDNWVKQGELSIRSSDYHRHKLSNIIPDFIYHERKILPVLRRNGFKSAFHDFAPHILFSFLLRDKKAEILIKSGYGNFLHKLSYHPELINEFWNQIRIAMRHKYKIKDHSTWLDYLGFLKFMGKDINNPKYICPDDLKYSHDRYLMMKRKLEYKTQAKKKAREDAKANETYIAERHKFFNLEMVEKDMVIKPLKSVYEFFLQQESLNHCVYSSKYYTRKGSLILSASINNKPVETIEFSLDSLKVVQARGNCNQPSKHNKRILWVIKQNIPKIAELI